MSKKPQRRKHAKDIGNPTKRAGRTPGQLAAGDGDSTADRLVQFVLERYQLGQADTGEPFAVPSTGPNVAVLFRDAKSFRQKLLDDFREHCGKVVQSTAVNTAIDCLAGRAAKQPKVELPLRVAWHLGQLVIDMGDETGRAIVVMPGAGWRVVDRSPVVFRRSELTLPLALPAHGATLADVRHHLRIEADDWPMVLGWVLSCFLKGVPRPLLVLMGSKGAGKSVLMSRLMDLVDPSPDARRCEPRNPQDWQLMASKSHVVAIDNISEVPAWFSECLCRAATGEAAIARELYTSKDLSIVRIKAPVVMTTLGLGHVKADLGERLLPIELSRIEAEDRTTEGELNAEWARFLPLALGAVLDALARVLSAHGRVNPPLLPRMADFAKLLVALDVEGLTQGAFEAYDAKLAQTQRDDLQQDAFACGVAELVRPRWSWVGTATKLIESVTPCVVKSERRTIPLPNRVRPRLETCREGLLAVGIDVRFRKGRDRLIEITYDADRDTDRPENSDSGGMA